ncbi:hypothetical protein, partial [Mesorhizobium sp.]|uniref:hypothetical protein n=1 Tax=Mesorhizobium sp. TaxID=1871066 RepID=UPI0025D2E9C3
SHATSVFESFRLGDFGQTPAPNCRGSRKTSGICGALRLGEPDEQGLQFTPIAECASEYCIEYAVHPIEARLQSRIYQVRVAEIQENGLSIYQEVSAAADYPLQLHHCPVRRRGDSQITSAAFLSGSLSLS